MSAYEVATRVVRRSAWARRLVGLVRGRSDASRRAAAAERRALDEVRSQVEPSFGTAARSVAAQAPQAVLVPAMPTVRHIVLQAPVLAGFLAAGFEPVPIVFDRNPVTMELYRLFGARRFVHFDRHDARAEVGMADRLLRTVRTQDDLLQLEHDDVQVGRYAASSMLRATRAGRLDLADDAVRTGLRRALRDVLDHAEAARRMIREHRPGAVLFLDKGYTPQGPLFDVALGAGARTFTWNMAHRDNALMLRSYGPATRDEHPAALSSETWKALLAAPADEVPWDSAYAEIRSSYEAGEWFSEVGTQFHSQMVGADDLREELRLDGRPVVGIFPHIFWDATFFWGTDLFADYEDWFVETARAAYENDAVQWVVKVHPANLVKNVRDGVHDEPSEVRALRRLGPPPSHVHILPADAPIATLSLLELIDVCCTVRGTVGIEAAALGAAVVTAGTGRYDGLGFTIDPPDREAYVDVLRRLPALPVRPPDALDRARRYAYGVFLLRPLRLETIDATFQKDPSATLDVRLMKRHWDDVATANDVRALAEWIASSREDFVDTSLLPSDRS